MADALSMEAAMCLVAVLTFAAGVIVAVRMVEPHLETSRGLFMLRF